MEKYYNAGYFLMKLKKINFGSDKNSIVHTCSGCINVLAFDYWCLSWTNNKLNIKEKLELGLTDEMIIEIQNWTDKRFNENEINWGNAFPNLETALTYKKQFFNNNNDINIYTIYFSEQDINSIIYEFESDNLNNGNFALMYNLLNKIVENDNGNEEFIGYDFIGVECDGSFHSIYCHDITKELINRFELKLNKFGLFENIKNFEKIKEYLNDPKTLLEPVPWFIVKTKRIKNAF